MTSEYSEPNVIKEQRWNEKNKSLTFVLYFDILDFFSLRNYFGIILYFIIIIILLIFLKLLIIGNFIFNKNGLITK